MKHMREELEEELMWASVVLQMELTVCRSGDMKRRNISSLLTYSSFQHDVVDLVQLLFHEGNFQLFKLLLVHQTNSTRCRPVFNCNSNSRVRNIT